MKAGSIATDEGQSVLHSPCVHSCALILNNLATVCLTFDPTLYTWPSQLLPSVFFHLLSMSCGDKLLINILFTCPP